MASITFWGASDDLVEIEGDLEGCDEYPLGILNSDLGQYTIFEVRTDRERVEIVATYTYSGTWTFMPVLPTEDDPWPAWPMQVSASPQNDYSLQLTIEVPDGTVVAPVEL